MISLKRIAFFFFMILRSGAVSTEKSQISDDFSFEWIPESQVDSFDELWDIKRILTAHTATLCGNEPKEESQVLQNAAVQLRKLKRSIDNRGKNRLYATSLEYFYLDQFVSFVVKFYCQKVEHHTPLPCLPHAETSFRKVFFYHKDAQEFVERKFFYYFGRQDKLKLDLWQGRLRSLRHDHFPNSIPARQKWTYASSCAENVGISYLHELSLYGEDVKAAILDVNPDYQAPCFSHQFLKKNLIEGSTPHLTAHSCRVVGILAGDVKTIYDSPSVAPNCDLFHYVTKKWGYSKNVGKWLEYQSQLRIVKSRIEEWDTTEFVTDVILEDKEADIELETFFRDLIYKKINIVNVSRDLLLGPKSQAQMEAFIEQGGLLVVALGNGGFRYTEAGIYYQDNDSFRIAACQLPFVRHIFKNPFLKKGVIFVGEANEDPLKVSFISCQPGNMISDRTIFSFSNYKVILNQFEQTIQATSGATAVVSGIIVLLKEAFPSISPQEIAQTLLECGVSFDGYPGIQGKGLVNAQKTYCALQKIVDQRKRENENRE